MPGLTLRHLRPAVVAGFALVLPLLAMNLGAAEDREVTRDQRAAAEADALYARGEHRKALPHYLRLAKRGDPFSQYRASWMYLLGEGTPVDYPEAFAWAVLAAESGDEQLFTYLQEVKARVPVEYHAAAEERAASHTRQWGRIALAIEARRKADDTLRSCTGSRLGTRCDEVYAMQMPRFWKINPGAGDGTDGGSAAPSGSISAPGFGAGGETRDAEYYQQLRAYVADLDRFIAGQAGQVEIGEFQVIEPGAQGEPAADDGHD